MMIKLSLENPGYLARNGIFRFPADTDDFNITVVANVLDQTVNGIGVENEPALDVLGYCPVVDTANIIWMDQNTEEQADVDGVLNIEITDVIVEEHPAEEEEDDQHPDDVLDRPGMTFLPYVEPTDADDIEEDDEILACANAEQNEQYDLAVNERRKAIEVDLNDELVGKKLVLEFTAGVLVRWSLA